MLAVIPAGSRKLCFIRSDEFYITELPVAGESSFYDLDVLLQVTLPEHCYDLTYDGEYWWTRYSESYISNYIYCFDENGEYVSDFPAPNDDVTGLAWDGEYLWIVSINPIGDNVFQRDIYGNPGPYDSYRIDEVLRSVAINGDRLIISTTPGYQEYYSEIQVYTLNGNYLFEPYVFEIGAVNSTPGLGYGDGKVWVEACIYFRDDPGWRMYGFEYQEGSEWAVYSTVHETHSIYGISTCKDDFVKIAPTSLGKIKAYFESIDK
jgi:hypothetical protein